MFAGLVKPRNEPKEEQLLKLYWNRATVKRELSNLKKERFDLLDKLKEQEGAIVRAQEQLEGLERLLTNPLAAANAMVYFQLRHMWRIGALRVEQFAKELTLQREKREKAQLHETVLAKRKRRLDAINEKLHELLQKRKKFIEEGVRYEQRLQRMNVVLRLFVGYQVRRRLKGIGANKHALEERIQEFNELIEKIRSEPLPEPEGLSLESRRLINVAVIALAQHLAVHFCDNDLATLAKASTERPVADMKFGDRRTCDRMVEMIREKVAELNEDKHLADAVKRRTDGLINEVRYRHETDTVPQTECVDQIPRGTEQAIAEGSLQRRVTDAPLRLNVLADDFWDLFAVLR
jgi:hypothetical protein